VLFAVVAAVAFATILAVVAGITLASSVSVAHDLYASLKRPGTKRYGEVAVARVAAVGVGAVAIGLGLLAQDLNVAFLVGLAFAVAASANLPVLLYTLFWRKFTTRGAVWSVYGGLVPSVLLVVLSPVVSGSPEALFPGMDFQIFPLQNPGMVSIPLGFLAGWLGTVTSPEPPDEGRHAETEVRALTGAGAV
jgi:cation/acetate symporter